MRGKLAFGVIVAALPLLAVATKLTWGTSAVWLVWLLGLLSLGLGLRIVSWANRPLSSVARRARELAGVRMTSHRWLGLFRTDPPGDQVISQALDRIERNLQEIRGLHRIGQLVASDKDLEVILTTIIKEAVTLLQADAGLIGTWDSEREIFHDVAACNLPISFPGREFSSDECLAGRVAQSAEVISIKDYLNYPHRLKGLDRFKLRATLGVPLLAGDEVKGALTVHSVDPERRFTFLDGQLLLAFASQAGAAFDKARLHQLALDQLRQLEETKEELARESRELEKALSNIVRIQEEERARIAADAHDGVVQLMVGSLCELQAAMAHLPDSPDLAEEKQERARDLLRQSITELRRVIYNLRPIALDAAGLVPALESLQEDYQELSEAQLELQVLGTPCRFSPETEIGAYRIIQEGVNNAIKHAEAKHVEIAIRFSEGTLEIQVADDGRGFSVEEAQSVYDNHAGLVGMKERARTLGGELSISSTAGQGTTVRAVIPYSKNSQTDERSALRLAFSDAPTGPSSMEEDQAPW